MSKGMTIEEAIETNSKIKWYVEERIGKAHAEALQLGIEALELKRELQLRAKKVGLGATIIPAILKPLPSEKE